MSVSRGENTYFFSLPKTRLRSFLFRNNTAISLGVLTCLVILIALLLFEQRDAQAIRGSLVYTYEVLALFYVALSYTIFIAGRQWKRAKRLEEETYIRAQELGAVNLQLSDARSFLKNILNYVADPIFVKDQQHRWIAGNSAFWELMGKPEEEVIGKSDYEFFPKEEADIFWKKDNEVLTSGIPNLNIETLTDPQGNVHTLSTKKACFTSADGSKILVGIIRDITELTRIQEQLKESDEKRLKSIMEHAGLPVYIRDLEGKYLQVNSHVLALFKAEEKDVLGKTNYDLFAHTHKNYVDVYRAHDCEVAEKGVALEFEEIAPLDDGIHIFTSVKFPLFDSRGMIYGICGISRDITEHKKAETAKALLASIVEYCEDAIISKTLDGIITSWNGGAERLFGYSAKEAIGNHVSIIIPPERAEEEEYIIHLLKKGKNVEHLETVRRHKNGALVDIALSISPILDNKKNIVGASKIARDISERKTVEKKLLRYTQELERSNQELDDFAYIVSHDLKEPLRGLFNHASFLLEDYQGKLDADGVRRLERLSQLAQRMEHLVNDLLYFSRLGRTELAVQQTDLNAIIVDIQQMMEGLLKERKARIIVPKPLPSFVCDRPRITEVFRNLITNAVKYNDKPEPLVEIGFKEEVDGPNGIEKNVFYVKDNGIGIEPIFYQDVFRIFKRLQPAEGKESGTGAGLTFVKKIIERHHGRIWIDSELGKQSIFYFTLERKEL